MRDPVLAVALGIVLGCLAVTIYCLGVLHGRRERGAELQPIIEEARDGE